MYDLGRPALKEVLQLPTLKALAVQIPLDEMEFLETTKTLQVLHLELSLPSVTTPASANPHWRNYYPTHVSNLTQLHLHYGGMLPPSRLALRSMLQLPAVQRVIIVTNAERRPHFSDACTDLFPRDQVVPFPFTSLPSSLFSSLPTVAALDIVTGPALPTLDDLLASIA